MLIGVTEARAKVGSIQLTPELLNNPQAFAQFQAAQGQLTQALKSLFAVAEAYPDLKSDAEFPRPAGAARGHGEPHHRGAQPLHRCRAGIQHHRAPVPDQPHREDVRLRGEAELHGGERSADRRAAQGGFRHRAAGAAGDARRPPAVSRSHAIASGMHCGRCRCCCGLGTRAFAQALQPVPALEARVTDLTGTLTAEQQASLEEKLAAFESRKGSQVAVLIVPTTEPEDIEQFGIRVVEQWKLGRGKVGRRRAAAGREERPAHAHRSRATGSKARCTDATAKRIIDETITPLFRQGDFYGGINAGLDQMMRVIDGEPLPAPDHALAAATAPDLAGLLPFLFIGVVVASAILTPIFGRGVGALLTGGIAGGLVWLLAQGAGHRDPRGCSPRRLLAVRGRVGGGGWSSAGATRRLGRVRAAAASVAAVRGGGGSAAADSAAEAAASAAAAPPAAGERAHEIHPHACAICSPRAGARGGNSRAAVLARHRERPSRKSKSRHSGEIRFVVETALDLPELWRRRAAARARGPRCSAISASGTRRRTTACSSMSCWPTAMSRSLRTAASPRAFRSTSGSRSAATSKGITVPAASAKARSRAFAAWARCWRGISRARAGGRERVAEPAGPAVAEMPPALAAIAMS